ncbi:MAG: hypothetical protein K2X47_18250 [Bdellovibrionales bacterium]|nr:hypothetical protein [Bdellovibrionales bacterium]
MKNDKVFWISIVGVIVVMVILITQFAFRPHVIRLIKASAFQDPQEVGNIVHRQLQEIFRTKDTFEFRYASNLPEEFVESFRRGLIAGVGPEAQAKSFLFLPLDVTSESTLPQLELDRFPIGSEKFLFWIFPVPSANVETPDSLCPSSVQDSERFVGCLPKMEQRYFEKKKAWTQPGKWTATMTQFQVNQFVILVQEPKAAANP